MALIAGIVLLGGGMFGLGFVMCLAMLFVHDESAEVIE